MQLTQTHDLGDNNMAQAKTLTTAEIERLKNLKRWDMSEESEKLAKKAKALRKEGSFEEALIAARAGVAKFSPSW